MRRALLALAGALFTVLAFAVPASAAPGQVTVVRLHSADATAFWYTTTDTTVTNTFIHASVLADLEVTVNTQNFDLDGNLLGSTITFVDLPEGSSGFTFTIDRPNLANASVSGSGLPAMTCTYDANFNQLGCTDTTIDVNVTWTATEPISRAVFNSHVSHEPFSENFHANGTSRLGNATGTIGDETLTTLGNYLSVLANSKSGMITVCNVPQCQGK